jgi:L-rhamnose mutarotase
MKILHMNRMIIACCIYFLIGCDFNEKDETPKVAQEKRSTVRYGMITGVKPEKIEYYKKLHAHPWPEVINKIKECNIHNYSIYLQKIDDRYFLFSYFEYSGNDFKKDMQKMAADSVTQRWWKETDPCQLPLKEALAKHQIWTTMEEVFHSN